MEKPTSLLPTLDEAESKGLEVVAAPVLQDANDLLRTGVGDSAIGASVIVRADLDAVERISLLSGSARGAIISPSGVPSGG